MNFVNEWQWRTGSYGGSATSFVLPQSSVGSHSQFPLFRSGWIAVTRSGIVPKSNLHQTLWRYIPIWFQFMAIVIVGWSKKANKKCGQQGVSEELQMPRGWAQWTGYQLTWNLHSIDRNSVAQEQTVPIRICVTSSIQLFRNILSVTVMIHCNNPC